MPGSWFSPGREEKAEVRPAGAGKLTKYPHSGFALRPGALLTSGPALCSPPAGMAPGEVRPSKVHEKGNTEFQRKYHSSYSVCPKISETVLVICVAYWSRRPIHLSKTFSQPYFGFKAGLKDSRWRQISHTATWARVFLHGQNLGKTTCFWCQTDLLSNPGSTASHVLL